MKFIINSLLEIDGDNQVKYYKFSLIQMPDDSLDFEFSGIDKNKDLGVISVLLTEQDHNFKNFMQAYHKKGALSFSSEIVF